MNSHRPSPTPALATLTAALATAAAVAALCGSPHAVANGDREDKGRLAQEQALKANKLCYECHIDFEEEELSISHQKNGVACARCHGRSQPHMDDEVRATPPDAIFRGKAMEVFCLTCHNPIAHAEVRTHKIEAAAAKKAARPPRTCTACHGEHELVDTEAAKKAPAAPKKK